MYSVVLLALLATSPMTLAQIEAEALANNPEIQSVARQTRVAESRLGTAASLDDPQFGYRAWSTPILQPWNLNQTQHMFMFTQNLPAKGKRELRYVVASDDVEIQSLLVEAKKREVLGMVHQAFYRLLRTYDQIRIHHEQTELAQRLIEAKRIQYTAGKVPQKDVLQAGVAYSRLAEHLIMFEREADTARAELNALMGRQPDAPLDVSGGYGIIDKLPSQEDLQTLAFKNRPELLTLEAMRKQGTHKVQLAEKNMSPDYSLSTGYMLMPSGSMNRNGWIAEFSMTLPWLNRGKHDSEVTQAHEETSAVDAEYQKQRAAISREIRDARIRVESARKVVDLYRDVLKPDLQNVSKAATVAYQTNQSDLTSVLDTQNESLEAEHALFEAISDYEQAIASLERAIGAPLQNERKPL
jgi:cobalt-zinc-cadmium efflux system outer membrane protein